MTPHRTDLASLLPGLAFVALAVLAAADRIGFDTTFEWRWVWPVVLIGAGFALLAGLGRGHDSRSEDSDG